MKYLYILLVLMLPFFGNSQVFDKTVEAFNTTNVEILKDYMDKTIDISFLDDHKYLPKKKAITEIQNFLLSHGSISAKKRHEGNSKENNSNYRVLVLNTATTNYRVFVYTELVGDKKLIKELRFDKI